MKRALEWGGLIAGAVLIIFGAVTIFMGVDGRSTVRDSLAKEYIVGSPDMTPSAIKAEAKAAGLDLPRDAEHRGAWIAALVAHPEVIQRPIITATDGTAVVARDTGTLTEVVASERAARPRSQSR
jgi:hypothetical protein